MEKITVFGGGGFIGRWFCDVYPDDVIVNDKYDFIPHSNRILYFISTVDNYNFYRGQPSLDIETNLLVLIKVLENCKNKYGSDFEFNFVSSWFVYGATACPAREDDYCNPKGLYSITKRAAEQLLISYCETFGIRYRIFRMANVIGVGDKKTSLKKNAFQFIIKELTQGRDIETYSTSSIRDFIDVRDAVRAIYLLLKSSDVAEIYNIGSGVGYSVMTLIDYVVKATDSAEHRKFIEVPNFHKVVQVQKMFLDITKLYSLGYLPRYTILDTIDWIIENYKNEK